ncbi:MAG: tetratricopeptide repeat protein [Tannerellaceae bacterium]|jgi:tetratricopeptide (TPR) repeat protein|nr:tetratricopeptide repeat protein [Tannerellaceae bacterium]
MNNNNRHIARQAALISLCLLLFINAQGQDAKENRKFDYFFYEGLNLKNAGKYDAAFELFTHCLAIDSTSAPLLYELSSFYLQLDRPDKAVEMLKGAVRYGAGNFTYKMTLATTLRNLGMYGEAVEAYEELIAGYPMKMELYYYLADALTQEGEIGDAIRAYDTLESITGMNEGISMQKYRLYSLLEEPENAFKEVEKLAGKFPMEARYPIIIGDLYLEKGKTQEAYESYRKAYAIDSENPYYIVAMSNYYEAINDKEAAETQIRTALVKDNLDIETKVAILSRYILRLQQSQRGTENAATLFETLIGQHPEKTELRLMYGALLVANGKTDEAGFQYQLVTEMEPANAGAWQQLLDISLKKQDSQEVIRLCTRCIELFPGASEYYFYLGIGYFQEQNYDKALEVYNEGLRIIPSDNKQLLSTFYAQIGDIQHQAGQPEKAYEAYEKALELNDKNILVLNNYAYFLSLANKDLKKAERMSAQCIKLEPDNATYLDTYAWIFFKQGSYTLAKFYIESALKKDDTQSPELLDHYGDILFLSGEEEEAVIQWEKARERGKKSDVLDRKINERTYIEDPNAK